MSCRDEMLDLYHDGELEPAELREVEAHLAGCARCRAELDALRHLRHDLEALEVPPADPAWVEALVRAVPAPPPRSTPAPVGASGWLTRLLSARISVPAPVLAVMLLVALLGWRREPAPREAVPVLANPPAPPTRESPGSVDLASAVREAPTELWPDLDQLARDPTTRSYLEEWPEGWQPPARPAPPRRSAPRIVEEIEILNPAP